MALTAKDIEVGGVYVAKVGVNITRVKVLAVNKHEGSKYRRGHTSYKVVNLKTGREVFFKSATKFRSKVTDAGATNGIAVDYVRVGKALADMTDRELVAFYNILTAPTVKTEPEVNAAKLQAVGSELLKRGIGYTPGRRLELVTAK